jgi:hypothetical protein
MLSSYLEQYVIVPGQEEFQCDDAILCLFKNWVTYMYMGSMGWAQGVVQEEGWIQWLEKWGS